MKRNHLLTKLIALTAIALLTLGSLAACSGGSGETAASFRTLDEIKESGKVVIGVFSDKAPFGYIDENGDFQGYDVYFAERIAKDLGVTAEYVSILPAGRFGRGRL